MNTLPDADLLHGTCSRSPNRGLHAEVGKVNLKSNGDAALNDEFLLKSNGDEALNDGFP
jgi:hypothetical protein